MAYVQASQELQVVDVEKGSPAEEAGVQRKDIITTIDGSGTKDLLIDDSATLLRGPAGSKVGIVVRRAGATTPLDFILTRKEIKIQSVEASTDTKVRHRDRGRTEREAGAGGCGERY